MLKINNIFPILFIIILTLILAITNIKPGTYFTGWDNSHPEFNIKEFTKRIFSGAWVEFQGTGAPAAQSQLAELPRIPIIYFLKLILPDNLIRYSFMFLMIALGGIGIHLYLNRYLLNKINTHYKKWISCFGGFFYILNIVSLQQFFINFEMYSVQFAFFPFVLISLHLLTNRLDKKNLLLFIIIQLLYAPVGYVPTVFYFAYIFWLIYVFFLNLQNNQNFLLSFKKSLIIGLLIFFIHSFWIIPNIYYVYNNSHYVKESRGNQLFNMEALSSVKEAANLENFLSGIHYIFTWKDFNFSNKQYEPIFKPWLYHLSQPLTFFFLTIFQTLSIFGFFFILFDNQNRVKKIGLIFIYLFTFVFIWMGLFLPEKIINLMYKSTTIQESLRNPFTKLSNYYSFAMTIMICFAIEELFFLLSKSKIKFLNYIPKFLLISFFLILFYVSIPSFQGNLINNKLKAKYPKEYFEMFYFLKSKPKNIRILELPFLSYAGWLYYDWQHLEKNNGYQGMGFYIFGIPQSLITPDHARWTETTDFFYHELKYALESENKLSLKKVLEKYRVNLIIVDETSIWGNNYYDAKKIHQALQSLDYPIIWKKNFLTIYETRDVPKDRLIIPKKINFISANLSRIRNDNIYENIGEYINVEDEKTEFFFPFADLSKLKIQDVNFKSDALIIKKNLPNYLNDNYQLIIPRIISNQGYFSIPAEVSYSNQILKIKFPKIKIIINDDKKNPIILPKIDDLIFKTEDKNSEIIIWVNEKLIEIKDNQKLYQVFNINLFNPIEISYGKKSDKNEITYTYEKIPINQIDWRLMLEEIKINKNIFNSIEINIEFPIILGDLTLFPSENCSNPLIGDTKTFYKPDRIIYEADNYGVNCSHYNFPTVDPNYFYLLNIEGKNLQGRSIKFFINYKIKNTITEEYLMPKNKYSENLILLPLNRYSLNFPAINWETRSFGKKSVNEISKMKLIPLPVDIASQIKIIKKNKIPNLNKVKVLNNKSVLTFMYLIKTNCQDKNCYVGINQSYDKLWLAIDNNFNILPHFRYNNWANIWQLKKSQFVIVFYLPQIISFLCMLSIFIFIVYLLLSIYKFKN